MTTDQDFAAVLRRILSDDTWLNTSLLAPEERAAIERAIELLQLNHAKKEHQAEVLKRMAELDEFPDDVDDYQPGAISFPKRRPPQ